MRILLSNDDGIGAPGLKILEQIARLFSDDIWIVAPEEDQSAVSHSLTLRRPLRLREISPQRYAVRGTPTDCVLMALRHIMKDSLPDLIISGVNYGGNLAEDISYSGTVAAAMEGTLLGVRSIAFSLCLNEGNPVQWDTAKAYAGDVLQKLMDVSWPENVFMNVNFPDVPVDAVKGIHVVRQGMRQQSTELIHRTDPRGQPYFWVGGPPVLEKMTEGYETDLAATRKGFISITPLCLDCTHDHTVAALKPIFDSY